MPKRAMGDDRTSPRCLRSGCAAVGIRDPSSPPRMSQSPGSVLSRDRGAPGSGCTSAKLQVTASQLAAVSRRRRLLGGGCANTRFVGSIGCPSALRDRALYRLCLRRILMIALPVASIGLVIVALKFAACSELNTFSDAAGQVGLPNAGPSRWSSSGN